ncbi:PIN domain-containing protein [Candidatus Pacearchaeota archaeon]|nr:PIN domain-containing protein [Candidatus Pacearchaeota archaeon]
MNLEESYTEEDSFFFDSYAFFEILKGNKNYEIYKKCRIITTKLNIFELYLGLLREVNEETAEKFLNKYYKFVIDFDEDVIKGAAKLKNKLNNRNLSMADCIGYILSKQLGIKFLTGDKEFETLDNAEFVK